LYQVLVRLTEGQLRKQAEAIGAAVVLTTSHYTNTVSGSLPLTLPNNTTSYTNGTATVTGSGGTAFVNGSATTTTYGTQTVMLPYNIQRNDFGAVYFIKARVRLGLLYGQIDPATRSRLQTNAGVLVRLVVDGSPASHADILPGDIIMALNGQRVDNSGELNSGVKAAGGCPCH
jgi:hypothetical protein